MALDMALVDPDQTIYLCADLITSGHTHEADQLIQRDPALQRLCQTTEAKALQQLTEHQYKVSRLSDARPTPTDPIRKIILAELLYPFDSHWTMTQLYSFAQQLGVTQDEAQSLGYEVLHRLDLIQLISKSLPRSEIPRVLMIADPYGTNCQTMNLAKAIFLKHETYPQKLIPILKSGLLLPHGECPQLFTPSGSTCARGVYMGLVLDLDYAQRTEFYDNVILIFSTALLDFYDDYYLNEGWNYGRRFPKRDPLAIDPYTSDFSYDRTNLKT